MGLLNKNYPFRLKASDSFVLDAAGNFAAGDVEAALAELATGGGGASIPSLWKFKDSTVIADPGSGNFRFDSGTPASVTQIAIHNNNGNGADFGGVLNALPIGSQVYIQNQTDATEFILVTIDVITDNTTWVTLDVTVVSSGTIITNNKNSVFIFFTAGSGVTSHLNLTDIGTNNHATIDTHIADASLHFTEGSIDHGSIDGLSDDDHTQYLLADGSRDLTGNILATTNTQVQFRSSANRVFSSTTNVLVTDGGTTHNFAIGGAAEMSLNANMITFLNGATTTALGWVTSGQLDFNVASTIEMSLTADTLTFNAGASKPTMDWATNGTLKIIAATLLELGADGDVTMGTSTLRTWSGDDLKINIGKTTNRLNELHTKKLEFGGPEAVTIASGALTITSNFITVATQSGDATDDLDTINSPSAGLILTVIAADAADTVVMKDGTGNMKLAGDFSLDNTEDTMMLIGNGTAWLELSRSNNGA